MASITYTGVDTRQDGTVLWHGHVFKPNVAVTVDSPELLEAAKGNPFFDVSGASESADDGDETEEFGTYEVKRRQRGKYAVMKGNDVIADGLTKAEAEAHAHDLASADAVADGVKAESPETPPVDDHG